jgi:hypothetical protein
MSRVRKVSAASGAGNKAAVNVYNSDIRHRSCDNCGHVNPLGYTAFHNHDTPETREARKQW